MFTPIKRAPAAIDKIKAGEVANVYVTGNFASPRHVEFVCRSGLFDAIWFDLEHFDISTAELAVLNMVTRAYPVSTVARIRASDYQVVMRTLEVGVDGLMGAMVADADEARQIVNWAKFHNPHPATGEATGNRGWNGGNIDAAYGNIPPARYIARENTEKFILCQIETESALSKAAEIAAVPGVDGLFFGPGDYSASIGLAGQITHPEVHKAISRVADAARRAGKWWGTVAVGREMQAECRRMGGRFLCPGGDVKVMNLGIRELARSFQDIPVANAPETAAASY